MKNRFSYILFLGVCLIFASGCSNDNFFDIQSAMSAPKLTSEQEEIKTLVKEHFGGDILWKYPLNNGKYSPIIKADLTNNGESWQLVFCQIREEVHKVHILFLKQNQGKWEIFEDVIHTVLDVEKVYIQDIDEDGINEVVVFVKNFEDSYSSIYAYKCSDKHVSEVSIPDSFFSEVNKKQAK